MRVAIVADDLTGACDTAAAFAPSLVVLRGEPDRGAVAVFSTGSRADPPETAARKVAERLARLPAGVLTFKKVDSLLRGNVRAEFEALGGRPAVVCTAFPEQGRVVRNGWALPAGVDLRPLFPGAEIADAATVDDLRRLASDILRREPRPALVGSAGLARALAEEMGYRLTAIRAAPGPGTAVFVIGSTHEVTLRQVEHLRRESWPSHILLTWDLSGAPPVDDLRRHIALLSQGGLFLCGGDTAALACEALGTQAIRLEGEIAPGVPFGRIEGGAGHGVAVVTKSGGFGSDDILSCAAGVLSAQTREQ